MRVAYITHSTGANEGATKALLRLLDKLEGYGVEPIVIVPDKNGFYEGFLKRGVMVKAFNYRMNIYPPLRRFRDYLLFIFRLMGRCLLTFVSARKLAKFLKENEVQIVHTNTSVVEVGHIAASLLHLPHVYHVREYGDLDFNMHYIPSSRVVHRFLRKSYTICITKGVQKYHHLGSNNKSTVIYDGVMPIQAEPTYNDDGTYFLYAGRVEPAKGLDFLLVGYEEYVRRVASPLPLKVAGSILRPDFMSEIKNYIVSHALEGYIEFLGERSDICALMSRAKAIVISSSFEGFGFCMAEAMFNGCLVIGRDCAGTHEQFENGLMRHKREIGLRYQTPQELADCLINVASGQIVDLAGMKKSAFKTVNETYNSEISAMQVFEFYQKILSDNHKK